MKRRMFFGNKILGLCFIGICIIGAVIFLQGWKIKSRLISPSSTTGIVKGSISRGPISPLGGFCSAKAANIRVVFQTQSLQKFSVTTDANGNYSINLPPNTYEIMYSLGNTLFVPDIHNKGTIGFHKDVSVTAGQTISYDGCYDTGMR